MSHLYDDKEIKRQYDPAVVQLIKSVDMAKKMAVPQELIQELEESLKLAQRRDLFAECVTSSESGTCTKIASESKSHDWEKVHEEGKTSRKVEYKMLSGQLEGQFLKSFLSAQRAKRVLDVGMFTGYSAMSIAEALPGDGQVVTLEINEYLRDVVQSFIQNSPHKHKIQIVIGEALQSMAHLTEKGELFDAIFLDATKTEYEQYLRLCFDGRLLSPGGTVIIDNAFYHGAAYMDPDNCASKFGHYLRTRTDLHVVLVPLRDGIYLVRRRDDVDGGVL